MPQHLPSSARPSSRAATPIFALLFFSILSVLPWTTSSANAQGLTWITDLNGWAGWGALEHGNGDKVAIGRFNTLHVVWEDSGLIKYSTSNDGIGWTSPEVVAPGVPADMPSIASDSNGTLVVAFVANPDAEGMGQIHYARKAWGATSWSHCQVVTSGTQPDIDARGGRVHLTWTTINRVQYTTFPTTAPPAPMAFGEEIEISSCPNTGFIRPSVALVRESCDLVPKVAYLRYSDETTNPDGACASVMTEVGPRVCARDEDTGTWSLDYTDLVTEITPATSVEAISLSMNAQYTTGNTYVAWSDTSNGNSRTRLAHGRYGTWDAVTLGTDERHAHVAAKRNSLNGEYRVAWVSKAGFLDFVDWDASFRTGQWHTGATPTWTDPVAINIPVTTGGATAGRPQATYWWKCSGGLFDTVEAVAEVEQVCANTRLMNHITEDQSCPPITGLPLDPCMKAHVAYAFASEYTTHVDTDGLGEPSRVGRSFVEFFLQGEAQPASIVISWDRGRLLEADADGIVIDDPQAQVRVTADGIQAKLVQLAKNTVYDEIEPRQQCREK